MEQLVMAIALPLAKQYGMNKALEIAYERLGIASPEEQNPLIFGMNQPFAAGNITDSIKRSLLRKGVGTVFNSMPSENLPLLLSLFESSEVYPTLELVVGPVS